MNIYDVTPYIIDFLRIIFVVLAFLPIIHWVRYGSFGGPLMLSVFWLGFIDTVGAFMADHALLNTVMGFIYPPMAIALYFWSYSYVITSKNLYRVFTFLAFGSVVAMMLFVVFVHGMERTGYDFNNFPYALATPVIISMAMLVELDVLLRDAYTSYRGMMKVNRAWLLYYSIGYIVFGTRGFSYKLVDVMNYKDLSLLRFSISSVGYVLLTYLTLKAIWKHNLMSEWKSQFFQK